MHMYALQLYINAVMDMFCCLETPFIHIHASIVKLYGKTVDNFSFETKLNPAEKLTDNNLLLTFNQSTTKVFQYFG